MLLKADVSRCGANDDRRMSNDPSNNSRPSDPDQRSYGKPSITRDHPRFLRVSQAGIGRDRKGCKQLLVTGLLFGCLLGAIALVSALVMTNLGTRQPTPPAGAPTTEQTAP